MPIRRQAPSAISMARTIMSAGRRTVRPPANRCSGCYSRRILPEQHCRVRSSNLSDRLGIGRDRPGRDRPCGFDRRKRLASEACPAMYDRVQTRTLARGRARQFSIHTRSGKNLPPFPLAGRAAGVDDRRETPLAPRGIALRRRKIGFDIAKISGSTAHLGEFLSWTRP